MKTRGTLGGKHPLRLTAALIAALGCNVATAEPCSPQEIEAITELNQAAFAAGASLDFARIQEIARRSQLLMGRLSPSCRQALQSAAAARRAYGGYGGRGGYGGSSASRPPSVYYDRGSDTYHAPGAGVSCGPSGCYSN